MGTVGAAGRVGEEDVDGVRETRPVGMGMGTGSRFRCVRMWFVCVAHGSTGSYAVQCDHGMGGLQSVRVI